MFKLKRFMLTALAVILSACTVLCLNIVPAEAADYEEGDAQLQAQIDAMKTTLSDLTIRTGENAASIAELSTTVDEAQELVDEVKASGEATAADVAELEAALAEAKAALNQRIDDLTARVQGLTASVGENAASIAALGTAIDEANTAIEALENNTALKSEVNTLRNTTDAAVAELKSKVNLLNNEIVELKSKLESVDNSNMAHGAEIAALGTAIDEANTAIEALEDNAALKSEVNTLRNITDAAVAELRQKIADLTEEISGLEGDVLNNRSQLVALGTAIDVANEAIESLENNAALKSEVNALRNTTDAAVAELKTEINSLKARLDSTVKSTETNTADIAELDAVIKEANDAIAALENSVALKIDVDALRNRADAAVAELKTEINSLKARLDNTVKSTETNAADIAELDAVIKEANDAIAALENSSASADQLVELKASTELAVAKLLEAVAALGAKINSTEASMDREVENLRAELKASKTEARILCAVLLVGVVFLAIMMFIKKKGKPSAAPGSPCEEPSEMAEAANACDAIDLRKPEASAAESFATEENGVEKQ